MIVATKQLFAHAYGKYAIGAYNINNLEQIIGMFQGSIESQAPFIIQLSKGARGYSDKSFLEAMIRTADTLYPEAIFAVHLDHGDEKTCYDCIDSGFYSSVMIDASHEDFEENIAITKRVVDRAHAVGISVEAELGMLGGVEEDINVDESHACLTDPEQAKEFVERTPKMVVDATEDGAAAYLAGCPTRIGQEAASEFGEVLAPAKHHPEWVQSFTYGFLLRWEMDPQKQKPPVTPPAEYDVFKQQGEYTLDYVYRGNGIEAYSVPYGVLDAIKHTSVAGTRTYQPFWTYRRLQAAGSFTDGKSPQGDIALINWRGNDFHLESYIDKPLDDQVRILNRGRDFAIGFLYWLQTECPRDDGNGKGYPEMQPFTNADEPLVDALGVALHPYIRESRRIVALEMLTANHMDAGADNKRWGTEFDDSIGCAHYAIDIHPSANEPHLLQTVVPYHIPLGALIPASGPRNLVAGAKNFGASRLALASARMHPTEWLVGEVAGMLAAMSTRKDVHPAVLKTNETHRTDFLEHIAAAGITRYWSNILSPIQQ